LVCLHGEPQQARSTIPRPEGRQNCRHVAPEPPRTCTKAPHHLTRAPAPLQTPPAPRVQADAGGFVYVTARPSRPTTTSERAPELPPPKRRHAQSIVTLSTETPKFSESARTQDTRYTRTHEHKPSVTHRVCKNANVCAETTSRPRLALRARLGSLAPAGRVPPGGQLPALRPSVRAYALTSVSCPLWGRLLGPSGPHCQLTLAKARALWHALSPPPGVW